MMYFGGLEDNKVCSANPISSHLPIPSWQVSTGKGRLEATAQIDHYLITHFSKPSGGLGGFPCPDISILYPDGFFAYRIDSPIYLSFSPDPERSIQSNQMNLGTSIHP